MYVSYILMKLAKIYLHILKKYTIKIICQKLTNQHYCNNYLQLFIYQLGTSYDIACFYHVIVWLAIYLFYF